METKDYDEVTVTAKDFDVPWDDTHTFPLAYRPHGWPDDEWMFTREDVSSETPNAFPMTWVSR